MHRNFLLIILTVVQFACSKENNSGLSEKIIQQQKELVELQIKNFDDAHVLRGMLPRDRTLLKQLRDLVDRADQYYHKNITQDSLRSFVLATNLSSPNKELLIQGLPDNEQSAFIFAARAAHLFRKQFESHYFHLDYVQPIAIRDKDSLKVFMIAASSAIAPSIFLDNKEKYQRVEPSFKDFPLAAFDLNQLKYLNEDVEFSEGTKKGFGYLSLPVTLDRDTFLTIKEYDKHLLTQ